MPLEENILDCLITQLIACLTQTKLKEPLNNNYNNNFNDRFSLLNTDKKLKKNNFKILKEILRELAQKPVKVYDKNLAKLNTTRDKSPESNRFNNYYEREEDFLKEHRPRSQSTKRDF